MAADIERPFEHRLIDSRDDLLGLDAEFEKVANSDDILEMGVMRTPGLAIDGSVQKSGTVLSVEEIEGILKNYQGA